MENLFFNKDIGESDDGLHVCRSSLASCVNTLDSFNCSCNHGFRFSLSIERSMYSLRNDPQALNDPQIDLEMVPISPHLDPEMILN